MEFHVSLIGRKDLSGEIYRQLRRAILEARLRPGDFLPASRGLARSLNVARSTVTVAYERLAAEGYVTSRVGSGTRVREQVAPPRGAKPRRDPGALCPRAVWESVPLVGAFDPPARFDFRTGLPDASLFPHRTWRRLTARQLRAEVAIAGVYGHPAGHRGLREAIARHIGVSRGVVATADDVTVTSGTQQGLDVVARALLAPGDRVAVEDPGYPPPRWLLDSLGARTVGVPVDHHGLVVEALPRDARLVYVTPSHQYPMGVPMALPRRLALLAWAERHNAAIVEDDYDTEFRFGGRPIEPLQTLDTMGRVLYLGSFSKTLLPTLRLGFVVAPPSLQDAVRKAKYVADWHGPILHQAVLSRFIDEGGFARHIRRVGGIYRVRHELITRFLSCELAEHLEMIPSSAGLHVTALARRASTEQLQAVVRRAAERGVQVQELSRFAVDVPVRTGLVLGYGAIATERIEEGLRQLKACLER